MVILLKYDMYSQKVHYPMDGLEMIELAINYPLR
jgi:hypothetical protein